MIGDHDEFTINLYTEKVVGNINACIGFIKGKNTYVPNTLLKTDMRNHCKNVERILLILRKQNTEDRYSEITYAAKNIDLISLDFSEKFRYIKSIIKNP